MLLYVYCMHPPAKVNYFAVKTCSNSDNSYIPNTLFTTWYNALVVHRATTFQHLSILSHTFIPTNQSTQSWKKGFRHSSECYVLHLTKKPCQTRYVTYRGSHGISNELDLIKLPSKIIMYYF